MSDEQMIYLDPNDDLNRVTERVEAATKQRVVLIVPPQTQLRSNVFWRLLHSRARGLGKDVTIVSADRQVRSVAKIAGFRIADAPDSPSSSKSSKGRSSAPSRLGRSQGESRMGHQPRSSLGRHAPGPGDLPPRNLPAARLDTAQDRPAQPTWREVESASSQNDETVTGPGPVMDVPPPQIDDDDYDRPFEFRIGASQAISLNPQTPRKGDSEEQEQDPFIPDYEKSRGILESWQSGQAARPAQPAEPVQPVQPPQPYQPEPESERTIDFPLPPLPFEPASSVPGSSVFPRSTFPKRDRQQDPFDVYDDQLPAPLPEQRGAAFVQDLDDGTPDIADTTDEVAGEHEIEDLGDLEEDDGQPLPQAEQQRQWPDLFADEPEDDEPRRVYGSRPRSSRSGTLSRRSARDFYDDEDQLAPIEDRPTGSPILPVRPAAPSPQPPRQTGGLAARASSGAIAQPQRPQRNVTVPPSAPMAGQVSRVGAPVAPAARPAPRPPARPRAQRRGRGILAFLLVLFLLLFLGGVGLFYYGTSATVTLTLPSKSLGKSHLSLIASTDPQNKAQNTVASQVLSFPASVTGTGTATGKTPQGSSKASGSVTFTNKGSQFVHIPSGTVISTPAGVGGSLGVTFVTTVDAVIAANSFVPMTIQAQNAGVSGNVGAKTITVIPADSLTAIAAAATPPVSTSSLNLSVTNPQATTGGGAANVAAATKNDIAALKLKLHQQIQAQVKAWLQTQLHAGDQRDTPIPDVLGSANPLSAETLSGTPAVGQALGSSTIKGTLTVQVNVLVVRAAAIQLGAQQLLNQDARKMKPTPYTITTAKAPVHVSTVASSSSHGGTVLTITFNAVGQIVPYIITGELSADLSGKTVNQATSDLNSGAAGVPSVQKVSIIVSPSFLNLMPFRPEHILIIVQPGSEQP